MASTAAPMTRTQKTHAIALDYLKQFTPRTVLDACCGNGDLATKLLAQGLDVTCLDVSPDAVFPAGAKGVRANLDQPLPIPDGAFDGVFCIEGIEHLENPHHMLREFHRILKPGGFLVVSTPNIMALRSRWKFLFSGRFSKFSDFLRTPEPISHLVRGHLNPVGLPELEHALVRAGYQFRAVRANNLRGHGRIRAALARLILGLHKPKHHPHHEVLLTDDLLYGENIVVLATRA